MKAIILAAGKGTRLRPLTYFINKCMIKIDGKPVLQYLVEHLNKFGITEIMVNLHYRPMEIIKHFGSRLIYSYEPRLLGEEGTLKAVSPWFNDYTVVMNGDTLTNINILSMFDISGGESLRCTENGVYTGTRIIRPYYQQTRDYSYQNPDTKWLDIGTWPNLMKARKFVKDVYKNTYPLPKM